MTAALPPAGFADAVAALGVRVDDRQLALLGQFVARLLDENTRTNLTAVRDPEQAWTRHVLDSLSLLPALPPDPRALASDAGALTGDAAALTGDAAALTGDAAALTGDAAASISDAGALTGDAGASIVDVGAGGGLPGLPLSIMRPDLRFTLIDATGKKVRHIAQTAQALGLGNVRALHGRAEDLCGLHAGTPPEREQHDVAVCRALAPMPVLLELVSPFLKVGGRMLAIKGQRARDELHDARRALQLLQMRVVEGRRTDTGTIVTLEKTAPTPKRFPRRPGEPKRAPIV